MYTNRRDAEVFFNIQVIQGVKPDEQLIKVVHDEMKELLGIVFRCPDKAPLHLRGLLLVPPWHIQPAMEPICEVEAVTASTVG